MTSAPRSSPASPLPCTTRPGPPALRTLLAPGGFSQLVGYHLATLDLATAALHEVGPAAARTEVASLLRAAGEREASWLHAAVGRVPTPPAPPDDRDPAALLSWLDAVRTVSLMVLRPLADRDLERLVELPGLPGRTTLRRLLVDLSLELSALGARARIAAARPPS